MRKPPWSVRGKKTASKEMPPTPSNMSRWNQPDFPIAGPSSIKQTPSRARIADFSRGSPGGRKAGQAPRSSQVLPGFVNAFQPSSPTKSPEPPRPSFRAVPTSTGNVKGQSPSRPRRKLTPQSSPTTSQYGPIDMTTEDTLEGNVFGQDEDEQSAEDFDQIEPINWAAEVGLSSIYIHFSLRLILQLHHIIFTHSLISSSISTVQTLMSVTLPSTAPQETLDIFSRASTELWTILSSVTAVDRLPMSYLYTKVSNSLTKIAWVLNVVNSVGPPLRLRPRGLFVDYKVP